MYREELLEHWRNPLNFGKIEGATLIIDQINPLCGDQVTFYFKIENGKVKNVKFTGNGCAISIAASSILSEKIKNKNVKSLSSITGKDVLALLGGTVAPARLKCVFLSLEVIRKISP
jgi:nitrogen fixation NifU-like protein